MKRYFHDIIIALESILSNKLKSVLTALGIIFGVAAVISMLAIGKGAQQEILEQIKMVGVNNILINPIVEEQSAENGEGNGEAESGEKQQRKFSRGLSLLDVEAIRNHIPSVQRISPEIALNAFVVQNGKRSPAKLVGVANDYFGLYNLKLTEGTVFNDYQEDHGIQVCVIGANIKAKFFAKVNPINQYIKFGAVWLKVIGVLEKTDVNLTGFEETGVNVYNDNIYVPVKTMLLRFQNRALVSTKLSTSAVSFRMRGMGFLSVRSSDPSQNTTSNYNQLDRIVVQVKETEQIQPTTEILSRMILRRHSEVKDFEITVPELLLKQQQRTKDIFNIVLGAIASISLVVGGIGIMNIMFASVMERIKEIGTRMAIGAKKMDIVVQFLSEAILISVTGGFIGIALGMVLSKLINQVADILTIVSPFSVIIAFGVSGAVGVIFGYSPAKRAAEKDPIESLRYE
ncbi:MAG: ABC transporter permease [Bacteroidales bacterium]|nr:MAG: ABC transporter permease [Bacteroidales bacterium]